MLWTCCTQYASKFGKLSSGHRTGKGPLSFQFQRKVMAKNVQTTTQLHSSHTLANQCLKFAKPGFNSTWTKVLTNGCFWTMVLEKTLESPLDCKEIKPVNPEGNQSWIFIGRTDAEAETPILWPPDAKNWHWRWPWYWKRVKAGGKGDNRGWDGEMASLSQWTWVWARSGCWWWTGKPGVLQSMGL